ncbi:MULTISPECIES: hypothetical protein [unclassified Calothrix]|nr:MULTISPECIES: hypothetical protein [unclassified Calothrix]
MVNNKGDRPLTTASVLQGCRRHRPTPKQEIGAFTLENIFQGL